MVFAAPIFFCLALGTSWEPEYQLTRIIDYKSFRIPIRLDPDQREEMEQICLFVSTDNG
jgi:hypothetical protein